MITNRFIRFGERVFLRRPALVAYEPIMYLFLWGAALRIVFTDDLATIPFREVLPLWAEAAWSITSLVSPILAFLAYWLMFKSTAHGSSLAGLWIRLTADTGQFIALITFHLATASNDRLNESLLYGRYISAGTILFIFCTIVRDVWSLTLTHKLAGVLHERIG